MIRGESKISEKIITMITSKESEMNVLAMEVLKKDQPAVYAALLNYTGYQELDENAIKEIYRNKEFNIGTVVRYRGMDDCPKMVISNVELKKYTPTYSTLSTTAKYWFIITAKWYNKSSQAFQSIQDRLECFEIIKNII